MKKPNKNGNMNIVKSIFQHGDKDKNNIAIKFASDFKLNRTGHAKGQLIGGNLSVLSSVLGSKSTIKTEGKILFLYSEKDSFF